jgi:nucleoside-diphosphate-sugar epimerase
MDKLILGCGYLGVRVARQWLAAGHRVFATTRDSRRAAELDAHGLQPLFCDVLRPETLVVLPPVDCVLYCVGVDRRAGRSMREVSVQGLANVLAHLGGGRGLCRKLIYISSTSVYGQTTGDWVDETSATEPLTESGRISLEAEATLRPASTKGQELGSGAGWAFATVILRFAGIYGPGRLLNQQAIRTGTPLASDPDNYLNLIHVEDGATAVLAADERGVAAAIYNVSDDEPVRRREFYAQLAQLLHAPPPRFTLTNSDDPATSTGASSSSKDAANRRISNRRMKEHLPVDLQFPTYREGLPASVSA